jgi:hypothetical protein
MTRLLRKELTKYEYKHFSSGMEFFLDKYMANKVKEKIVIVGSDTQAMKGRFKIRKGKMIDILNKT